MSHFNFKQFAIAQQNCGMKVTTDACVFGALIQHAQPHAILDIGAGTGLLSLMLMQKYPRATATAVEIETGAYNDLCHNFNEAPWPNNQLLAIHNDFLQMDFTHATTPPQFDLIVSNPPFFERQLQANQPPKNIARHAQSSELSAAKLMLFATTLLSEFGLFWMLYPAYRKQEILNNAQSVDLIAEEIWDIKHQSDKNPHVCVFCFKKKLPNEPTFNKSNSKCLIIKNKDNSYTAEFSKLLAPYYLHL
jgi:tRNA1Val (adenine37-N6)-methyltransferase